MHLVIGVPILTCHRHWSLQGLADSPNLEESRQALRVRLLAACQYVVIVYTHPRFIPKITVTLIITSALLSTITTFLNIACFFNESLI